MGSQSQAAAASSRLSGAHAGWALPPPRGPHCSEQHHQHICGSSGGGPAAALLAGGAAAGEPCGHWLCCLCTGAHVVLALWRAAKAAAMAGFRVWGSVAARGTGVWRCVTAAAAAASCLLSQKSLALRMNAKAAALVAAYMVVHCFCLFLSGPSYSMLAAAFICLKPLFICNACAWFHHTPGACCVGCHKHELLQACSCQPV